MGKKEGRNEEYFNPLPFSHVPPLYKLAHCLIPPARAFVLQTPKSPHPNFKSYAEAELVGNEPSPSESIA